MTYEIQFGLQMNPAHNLALGTCWFLPVVAKS